MKLVLGNECSILGLSLTTETHDAPKKVLLTAQGIITVEVMLIDLAFWTDMGVLLEVVFVNVICS